MIDPKLELKNIEEVIAMMSETDKAKINYVYSLLKSLIVSAYPHGHYAVALIGARLAAEKAL